MGNTLNYYVLRPDVTPNDATPIETDPLAGFSEGARKRKGKYFVSFRKKLKNLISV